MTLKSARLSLAAVAAFGLMVSGCTKHPKQVATNTAPTPRTTQQDSSNTGTPANNDASARRATAATTAPASTTMTREERNTLNQNLAHLEDVLFDYDKATIRPDASKTLESDVTSIRTILQRYPNQKVKIEGHADERGSDEYNVALGDRRAVSAKEFLTGMGISGGQLDIVSYGKQRPVCEDHTEDCWQKNRRVHFVAEGAM
jgi:peptidoglycan-associated lipoprotein